jgi:hypothetical protein
MNAMLSTICISFLTAVIDPENPLRRSYRFNAIRCASLNRNHAIVIDRHNRGNLPKYDDCDTFFPCIAVFATAQSQFKSARDSYESCRTLAAPERHVRLRSSFAKSSLSRSRVYCIVGIENSAPSLTPDGQREVTVLVLV